MPTGLLASWFQSTHPRGVRLKWSKRSTKNDSFNPRTREGCDRSQPRYHPGLYCFNPRTREGCDFNVAILFLKFNVSIHAPARGATSARDVAVLIVLCFNPRTREGCDGIESRTPSPWELFQSTHPRGVRRVYSTPRKRRYIGFQSTHPRGVRLPRFGRFEGFYMFQSTHPRGVRLNLGHKPHNLSMFQSTHPRGVRLLGIRQAIIPAISFNPRTREGCDLIHSV